MTADNTRKSVEKSRLYPWYVHMIGGWSIGSIFPWYLSCSNLYRSGRKLLAWLFMGGTILLYGILAVAGAVAEFSWDRLFLFFLTINLFWSLAAWLVQRKYFGKAPRRYYLSEWKSWISPLIIAVVLGVGFSVCIAVFPIIGERFEMYQSRDLLVKKVILWDFFKYVPYSFCLSIPLGIWWAGERSRFSIGHILSFCFGLIIFSIILSSISGLFYFLLNKGQFFASQTSWEVVAGEKTVMQKALSIIEGYDLSAYLVVPLLVGAVTRVRDLWKRSLVLFPLLTCSFFLLGFYSPQLWQFYQDQIFYDMSSPEKAVEASGYRKASVLLKRFPEHEKWPEIACRVARYHHANGEVKKSEELYRQVIQKTKGFPRWSREAERAASALASASFDRYDDHHSLTVPPLRYESYMTNNWMTLIRTMRYFEGELLSETDSLMKLKEVSTKDEKIKLKPMPTLAELTDNAENLGYEILLLPSRLERIRKIIIAGYPVIHPMKHSFTLLSGVNSARGAFTGASYTTILEYLKQSDREGVSETSFLSTGETDEDEKVNRIDKLSYVEIPFSYWNSTAQTDSASYMAVVFPREKREHLVAVLGQQEEALRLESKKHLAALIGLNALKCGDPVAAITWARRSYRLSGDSFSLHVAHLASLLWESRNKKIESRLELEKQLPSLASVSEFLSEDEIEDFLLLANQQFKADLAQQGLSWMIRRQYKDFLDISSDSERQTLITLSETEVSHYPESRKDWLNLCTLYEWEKNPGKMLAGYSGALNAGKWNDAMAVKVAYLLIQLGKNEKADALIGRVQKAKTKYLPDYYYCLASLERWRKNYDNAEKLYTKAIRMRRYDRNYHLGYAEMLQENGADPEKVEKLQRWASRLGTVEREAPDKG